jgi:hypothetical protein
LYLWRQLSDQHHAAAASLSRKKNIIPLPLRFRTKNIIPLPLRFRTKNIRRPKHKADSRRAYAKASDLIDFRFGFSHIFYQY